MKKSKRSEGLTICWIQRLASQYNYENRSKDKWAKNKKMGCKTTTIGCMLWEKTKQYETLTKVGKRTTDPVRGSTKERKKRQKSWDRHSYQLRKQKKNKTKQKNEKRKEADKTEVAIRQMFLCCFYYYYFNIWAKVWNKFSNSNSYRAGFFWRENRYT